MATVVVLVVSSYGLAGLVGWVGQQLQAAQAGLREADRGVGR